MKYFYTFGLINPYLQNKYLSHYSYAIVQSKNPVVTEKGASIRVGKAGNGGTGRLGSGAELGCTPLWSEEDQPLGITGVSPYRIPASSFQKQKQGVPGSALRVPGSQTIS